MWTNRVYMSIFILSQEYQSYLAVFVDFLLIIREVLHKC